MELKTFRAKYLRFVFKSDGLLALFEDAHGLQHRAFIYCGQPDELEEGETYELRGWYEEHLTHGLVFSVEQFCKVLNVQGVINRPVVDRRLFA